MWDEEYSTDEYVYGTSPNDFLFSKTENLKKGRVLCLAEGEGRNAVHLAKEGFSVTAVDSSGAIAAICSVKAEFTVSPSDQIFPRFASFEF